MSDFGGIIKFRTPTGNLSIRGAITHKPLPFSAETVANTDGSLDRTITVTGVRFSLSLRNRTTDGLPVDLAAVYALNPTTFTILHESERVDRTYSGAFLTGDPSVDDMTGEITGIEGAATGFIETPR